MGAATSNYLLDKGYDVSAAISKFHAVKYVADQEVGPVTANTDEIAGFAQFAVTAAEITRGKGATVRLGGITEAIASGAVAVGDVVTLDADGRVSSGSSGQRIVGTCVGAPATNAGDHISLRVNLDGGLHA